MNRCVRKRTILCLLVLLLLGLLLSYFFILYPTHHFYRCADEDSIFKTAFKDLNQSTLMLCKDGKTFYLLTSTLESTGREGTYRETHSRIYLTSADGTDFSLSKKKKTHWFFCKTKATLCRFSACAVWWKTARGLTWKKPRTNKEETRKWKTIK